MGKKDYCAIATTAEYLSSTSFGLIMAKKLRNAALGIATLVALLAPIKANANHIANGGIITDGSMDTVTNGSSYVVVNPVPNSYGAINDSALVTINGRDYAVGNGDTIKTLPIGLDTSGSLFWTQSTAQTGIVGYNIGKLTKAQTPSKQNNELEIMFGGKDTTINNHKIKVANIGSTNNPPMVGLSIPQRCIKMV